MNASDRQRNLRMPNESLSGSQPRAGRLNRSLSTPLDALEIEEVGDRL
jgi:hypothetical protein